MHRSFIGSLMAILALTVPGRAEETYSIRLKRSPDVGKTISVTVNYTSSISAKEVDPDGKVLRDDKNLTTKTEEVYTEVILEQGDKAPNKYTRTYKKRTMTVGDFTHSLPGDGLSVVFTKKDGKYTVTADGGKSPSKDALDVLIREANAKTVNRDNFFCPSRSVRLGDSWKIDGKEVVEGVPGEWNAEKSSAEGKLTKAYQKDGHQFGIIVLKLKLVPRAAPEGVTWEKIPIREETITLDTAIDGSSTARVMTSTTTVSFKGTSEEMGKKVAFEIASESSTKKEQSAEK
jgi:hypothetical protein